MIKQLYGTKQGMMQAFTEEARITVTKIQLLKMVVTQHKNNQKDGYEAIQIGLGGKKRNPNKALKKHFKTMKYTPKYSREIRLETNDNQDIKTGTEIKAKEIIKLGDILNIQGTTKGKGFAGAIKRWGFARQPKTHGQSDRVRATGSIGQGTDPGRVHKGKKMPGRMGSDKYTVKNAQVVFFNEETNEIWVTGHVPGNNNGLLRLTIKSNKTPPKLAGKQENQPTDKQPEKKQENIENEKQEEKNKTEKKEKPTKEKPSKNKKIKDSKEEINEKEPKKEQEK